MSSTSTSHIPNYLLCKIRVQIGFAGQLVLNRFIFVHPFCCRHEGFLPIESVSDVLLFEPSPSSSSHKYHSGNDGTIWIVIGKEGTPRIAPYCEESLKNGCRTHRKRPALSFSMGLTSPVPGWPLRYQWGYRTTPECRPHLPQYTPRHRFNLAVVLVKLLLEVIDAADRLIQRFLHHFGASRAALRRSMTFWSASFTFVHQKWDSIRPGTSHPTVYNSGQMFHFDCSFLS